MEQHDDDKPIGRVLSRREMLALLGGASATLIVGAGLTRLTRAQTATPTVTGTAVPSCVVRHCDALGVYSGVQDRSFDTTDQKWLRGYQITDADGMAAFTTIYPGWYSGRTTHIHFKIRTDPDAEAGYEFTSQLFFDEDLTDIVHAQEPYASKGYRNTLNSDDNIFQSSEGLLTLEVVEDEDGGYTATFNIGLDLSDTSPGETTGGRSSGNRPARPTTTATP
jgi:hypothetical protein